MKANRTHLTLGALVLAISSAVYGQETAGTPDSAASGEKSYVRFEGTDLHIGDLPPITFHGFASQGFLYSDSYNYLGHSRDGSFEFNEFGLNASVSPFERTRIAAQAFTFDIGNVGNYDLMLDYGLIDYNFNEKIGIRAGRIRRPEGIYNHIQDVDLARTWVLLPQGMYDARYRDFSASIDGGSVYGDISLGKAGSLSYEVYGGVVTLSQEGGVARLLQDALPAPPIGGGSEVNGFPQVGGQLWWATPVNGLRVGVAPSYVFGFSYDYSVFGTPLSSEIDATILHYSLEYQWKSWTFQAEYESENYVSRSYAAGSLTGRSRSVPDRWYVSAAYRFNPWLETGVYYTESYADKNNRDGSGTAVPGDAYQKDLALAVRFDPKPWWIIKLEGHWIKGTDLLNHNSLNRMRDEKSWLLFAAKTTFSF